MAEELQHSSNALGIQQVRAARADRREHCLKNRFYSTRALPQEQLRSALATAPTHEHCLNLLYTTYTPALLLLLTPGIQQLTAALPVAAVEEVYSSTASLALPHLLLTAATVYSSAACLSCGQLPLLRPTAPPKTRAKEKPKQPSALSVMFLSTSRIPTALIFEIPHRVFCFFVFCFGGRGGGRREASGIASGVETQRLRHTRVT
jgi:hypothetical protein